MNSTSWLILPEKLKYYAFDWDDNILTMLTKIFLLKNWVEIWVTTKEFAEIRSEIWNWVYDLLEWNRSFRDFTEEWDYKFEIDFTNATLWPSWGDFKTCINNARLFSIITARWHSSIAMTKAIQNMIFWRFEWLDAWQVSESMRSFMILAKSNDSSIIIPNNEEDLVKKYLSLCKMYPVSNSKEMEKIWIIWSTVSPEEAKIKALIHFTKHVRDKVSQIISDKYETPTINIWASDDDLKNVESIKIFMKQLWIWEDILYHLFDTSWNTKKRVRI